MIPCPVSVIIPVYQDSSTLPRALESIAAQTAQPAEILVCNDGSPDARFVENLSALPPSYSGIPLRVFHQPNAGAGAARNRCIACSTQKYVAFLDADDWWLPHKLERSIAELERTGATFVAHDFFAVSEGGVQTHWHCAANSRRSDFINHGNPRTQYFYRGFIGILTVVMRRDALVVAGGFDAKHRFSLDWECWHAVMDANPGAFFHVFGEPLACYTLNPQGLTSKGFARLEERESYLPRYVRGVAREGNVWWPLLLSRGWLTIQYETVRCVLGKREWANLLRLAVRAPWSLLRLSAKSAADRYARPDFLATIAADEPEERK
jgi:glycosyltransferase involved in cell wall biosynthesis